MSAPRLHQSQRRVGAGSSAHPDVLEVPLPGSPEDGSRGGSPGDRRLDPSGMKLTLLENQIRGRHSLCPGSHPQDVDSVVLIGDAAVDDVFRNAINTDLVLRELITISDDPRKVLNLVGEIDDQEWNRC